MHYNRIIWVLFFLIHSNINSGFGQSAKRSQFSGKTLIVFFDGLRPDYITESQMPNLSAFRKEASYGAKHHSVFPTVTRVNSSSYATGSYPGTHGILGNAVFFPEVNSTKATGTSYKDLSVAARAISGPLLTGVSLGEALKAAGQEMMVFSSGTTGQAFLQNHTINGAIVNPDLILPESFKARVMSEIGKAPTGSGHNGHERHRWITDGLLKFGLAADGPLVSAIWYSDPDGAAHEHGMGSEEAVAAIKYVDGQFGRILEALKSRGLADQYNIIISTDHGFVTHIGKVGLTDFLIKEGFKKSRDSDDVVVAEGAIHVKDHDPALIRQIVTALQRETWAGAIFTKSAKPGNLNGFVKGTLSFDAIHYAHPRAGDILVAMDWNDSKNDKGYAGADYSGGVAGHGGSSPYEINIALFAKGPAFKSGFTGNLPTSNVDIAPTVLAINGIEVPAKMDGRILSEFLKTTKKQTEIAVSSTFTARQRYPWGTYQVSLHQSVLGKYRYVDFTKTTRIYDK